MRDLARRMLEATRSASAPGKESYGGHVAQVYERLGTALSKFAGVDGFRALVRRALKLASAEVPELESVRFSTNGKHEGLEKLTSGGSASEAAVALAAHILALLETFIGEPLTLRVVGEGWPELDLGLDDTSGN